MSLDALSDALAASRGISARGGALYRAVVATVCAEPALPATNAHVEQKTWTQVDASIDALVMWRDSGMLRRAVVADVCAEPVLAAINAHVEQKAWNHVS